MPRNEQSSPPTEKSDTPADPAGQSPETPIEFEANTDVARGNAERANAEPEPPALHDADVPGVPDERGK
jgi:hypothetical protein